MNNTPNNNPNISQLSDEEVIKAIQDASREYEKYIDINSLVLPEEEVVQQIEYSEVSHPLQIVLY